MQLNGRSSGNDADFETVAVDADFEAAEVSVDLPAVEVALAFESLEVFSAVFMPHLLFDGRWLKLLSHDATERLQRPLPTLCRQNFPESRER
jgi:hypothetical protein